MRSPTTQVEADAADRDAAALAGHLAALCDYAVARLDEPFDRQVVSEVSADLRMLRDMCALLADGAVA